MTETISPWTVVRTTNYFRRSICHAQRDLLRLAAGHVAGPRSDLRFALLQLIAQPLHFRLQFGNFGFCCFACHLFRVSSCQQHLLCRRVSHDKLARVEPQLDIQLLASQPTTSTGRVGRQNFRPGATPPLINSKSDLLMSTHV